MTDKYWEVAYRNGGPRIASPAFLTREDAQRYCEELLRLHPDCEAQVTWFFKTRNGD